MPVTSAPIKHRFERPSAATIGQRTAVFLFAAWLTGATVAHAASAGGDTISQQRTRSVPVLTVNFENDTFSKDDRHYTNGFKLSWLSADLVDWEHTGWRKRFVGALPFLNEPDTQKNFGIAFGQNIYTPQDISLATPDPADRPYAGWSYLEFSFISKTDAVMNSMTFQVGIVGPHSYAEDLQKVVHELFNDERPEGWAHQLKDEPGVNVVLEHSSRLYVQTDNNLLGADFVPHVGISLGNIQTYANAGATGRVGFNLPRDFGVNLIRAAGVSHSPVDEGDPRLNGSWSAFIFGGFDGRAVARDIFLDGNTFRDSPSVEKENWIADAYYGLGVVVRNWQFTYTHVTRTREFKAQDEANRFGSITISTTW